MENIKSLKVVLKSWNNEVFGNLDTRIDRLKEVVNNIDYLADLRVLSDGEIQTIYKAMANM